MKSLLVIPSTTHVATTVIAFEPSHKPRAWEIGPTNLNRSVHVEDQALWTIQALGRIAGVSGIDHHRSDHTVQTLVASVAIHDFNDPHVFWEIREPHLIDANNVIASIREADLELGAFNDIGAQGQHPALVALLEFTSKPLDVLVEVLLVFLIAAHLLVAFLLTSSMLASNTFAAST